MSGTGAASVAAHRPGAVARRRAPAAALLPAAAAWFGVLGLAACDGEGGSPYPGGCAGGWLDPWTGFCWEEPARGGEMDWWDAAGYCSTLEIYETAPGDWRLPTIDELRSLIAGCSATSPGGTCGVTDPACLSDGCRSEDCDGCTPGGAPGPLGCYREDDLSGDCLSHWSSSPYGGSSARAWVVAFGTGFVGHVDKRSATGVRCVRVGP